MEKAGGNGVDGWEQNRGERNGLLNKLIDRKISFHFISLLYSWYI